MTRGTVRTLQVVAPLAVIAVAGFTAMSMYWNRAPVEIQIPVSTPPGVRVEAVTLGDVALTVTSQGTVRPRTESQLVPEIAGRVTWVAPSFAEGGFFELGDVLLTIDPFDYLQAVVNARAQLAQARLRLAQEEAEADVAVREWDALGRGDPRALTLREPQLEDARASVAGAEASLERARRDLERAEIVAPYAGRVRQKNVDIGQFVRVGDAVATIYAVDVAEVRFPLPDEQLAYLDLPLSYRGGADQPQPRVTIRATFAGEAHEWQGRIVRTESEIDPVSRMVHAVAEVLDPYALGSRPPLAVGMYVEAEIAGRTARNVAVMPRAALRGRDRVLVVDGDDRLRFREIDVLRATSDAIYVRGGLAEGDLVVVSPIDSPTEGMAVQLADVDVDLLARRRGGRPATTDGMTGRVLDGSRMARAATDDAPALPSRAFAQTPDTDRVPEATAPAADVDIDPNLSRDEQLAAIRRRLALLRDTPAAPPTRTTPDDAPALPSRAFAPAPDTDRVPEAAAPAADFDIDPSLSRDEQLAAIRRRLALLRDTPATPPTRTTPDAAPGASDVDIDPNLSRDEQLAAIRRRLALLRDTPAAPPTRTTPDAAPGASDVDIESSLSGPEQIAAIRRRLALLRDTPAAPPTRTTPDAAPGAPDVDIESSLSGPEQIAAIRRQITGLADAPEAPPTRTAPDPAPVGPVANALAVLPFHDFGPSEEAVPTVDLGPAMTAAVAARLAELPAVTVVSSDDGASWVVGGGVQRIGGVVRVTARLIDVHSGAVLTAVKVDGTIDALAELEARVASALSERVREALSVVDATAGQGADAKVASAVGSQS